MTTVNTPVFRVPTPPIVPGTRTAQPPTLQLTNTPLLGPGLSPMLTAVPTTTPVFNPTLGVMAPNQGNLPEGLAFNPTQTTIGISTQGTTAQPPTVSVRDQATPNAAQLNLAPSPNMTPTTTIAGHYRVPTATTVAVTTVPVGQQWTPNPLTTSTGNTTAGTVTPGRAELPAPSFNLQGITHVVNTPTIIPVATTVTTGVPLAVTAANAFPNVYTEPYTRVNDRQELGPTQATPTNNPPLEPAPTRVDTRLISPRQAEFARRHAATSRGNVQPIINDTIEVEVGTPLDARGGNMQLISVPMREFYQTRTESFPTDAQHVRYGVVTPTLC